MENLLDAGEVYCPYAGTEKQILRVAQDDIVSSVFAYNGGFCIDYLMLVGAFDVRRLNGSHSVLCRRQFQLPTHPSTASGTTPK